MLRDTINPIDQFISLEISELRIKLIIKNCNGNYCLCIGQLVSVLNYNWSQNSRERDTRPSLAANWRIHIASMDTLAKMWNLPIRWLQSKLLILKHNCLWSSIFYYGKLNGNVSNLIGWILRSTIPFIIRISQYHLD